MTSALTLEILKFFLPSQELENQNEGRPQTHRKLLPNQGYLGDADAFMRLSHCPKTACVQRLTVRLFVRPGLPQVLSLSMGCGPAKAQFFWCGAAHLGRLFLLFLASPFTCHRLREIRTHKRMEAPYTSENSQNLHVFDISPLFVYTIP